MQHLRSGLYAHTLTLSPGHPQSPSTANVLTRLRGDVERTEYLIFTGPLSILADGAAGIVYTGMLLYLSLPLTLCALLVLPAFAWLSWRIAPVIREASLVSRAAEGHWMELAEERLEALPMIQAYGAQNAESKAFEHRSDHARAFEVIALMLQAKQNVLIESVTAICGVAVLALGAHQIAQGTLTAGALVAFIGAVGSLYAPLRALAKVTGRLQHAAAGAQRVAALLDTHTGGDGNSRRKAAKKCAGQTLVQPCEFFLRQGSVGSQRYSADNRAGGNGGPCGP